MQSERKHTRFLIVVSLEKADMEMNLWRETDFFCGKCHAKIINIC